MISFAQIEAQRKPWIPQQIKPEAPRFEGTNLNTFIQKSIALGLKLEIPVAEYIIEARKDLKNKDVPQDALNTLYRNIKDEAVHYKAFQYAGVSYGHETYDDVANSLYLEWNSLLDSVHPLWIAGMLETGVFLTNLAVLRLCGGDGLSGMSGEVARDEYRHVGTNRAILKHMGYDLHNPPAALDKLREETNDWLFEGLDIPALDIDKQFLMDCSDDLTYGGASPDLSELTAHAEYQAPFEISNSRLY